MKGYVIGGMSSQSGAENPTTAWGKRTEFRDCGEGVGMEQALLGNTRSFLSTVLHHINSEFEAGFGISVLNKLFSFFPFQTRVHVRAFYRNGSFQGMSRHLVSPDTEQHQKLKCSLPPSCSHRSPKYTVLSFYTKSPFNFQQAINYLEVKIRFDYRRGRRHIVQVRLFSRPETPPFCGDNALEPAELR